MPHLAGKGPLKVLANGIDRLVVYLSAADNSIGPKTR